MYLIKNKHFLLSFCTVVMAFGFANGRDNGIRKVTDMPQPGKNVFIQNVGQLKDENNTPRHDIDFKLPCNNSLSVFVAPGKLYYQWAKQGKHREKGEAVFYQMQVALEGANTSVKPIAYNKQTYRENFYTLRNEGSIAYSYQKLVYKNIYPHIDWIVSAAEGNASGMKYEFLVHKGGNPKQIKLHYYGADNISLTNGRITAATSFGTVEEEKPYCYTTADKKTVNSSFQLNNNTVSFDIDSYDGELLIDPSIYWGTYFGNPGNTQGFAVITDSLDNSFLCGRTTSLTDIVVSTYASQVVYGGGSSDAFIVKFNVGGTPMWSTYYGAGDVEEFTAATYDKTTNGLIAGGYTTSASNVGLGVIATPGAYQTTNGGTGFSGSTVVDCILAKFNDTGRLVWGTFFGGTQDDRILSIACDKSGFIYFGGSTSSTNAIASTGSIFRSAPAQGFIEKFNSNGNRVWGTYFCGKINAITIDADNRVYIGGVTDSATGVSTSSSHQQTFVGGPTDGFIAKFNDAGSRMWSSYYGGWGDDEVYCLVTDSFRNLYAGGTTLSTSNIATTGAFRSTHSAALTVPVVTIHDGFLAKFDSAGKRSWATYFGDSSGMDMVKSAAIGPDQKLYIAGGTGSLFSVATAGAFHSTWGGPPPIWISGPYPPNGPMDMFLEKFSPKGERMWGTYIGGSGGESEPNVAYGAGRLYVGGSTFSGSGIATAYSSSTNGGYQQSITNSGNVEAFVEQFYADTSVYFRFPYTDTILCAGDSLKVYYRVTNAFKIGNVFSVQLSDSSGNFTATSPIIGSKNEYREGVIGCKIPTTTLENTHYALRILASNPKDTFYNYDVKVQIYKYHVPDVYANPNPICENSTLILDDFNFPYAPNYTWIGPAGFSVPSTHNAIRTPVKLNHAGDYILVADNHGCIGRDTINVVVNPSPAVAYIVGDTSLCLGDTLNLSATCTTPGVTFSWIGPYNNPPNPPVSSSNPTLVVNNVSFVDTGYYKVSAVLGGVCYSDQDSTKRRVTIHPIPKPSASSNTPICEKETITLTASDTITSGITYSWSGPGGFSHNSKDTSIVNSNPTYSGRYTVRTTSIHGCSDTISTNVIVKPLPNQPDATNNSPICSGGTLTLNNTLTTPSATYAWAGPNGYSSSQLNPSIAPSQVSHSGIYTLTVDLAGCKKSDTTLVTINKTPDKPILASNSPLHVGDPFIKLEVKNPDVAATYTWSGPNSFSTTAVNPILNSVVKNMGGKYIVVASIAGCTSSDSITVQVDDNIVTAGKSFIITPNPNRGTFSVLASVETDSDIPFNIYASDGKLVYGDVIKPVNKKVVHTVDISGKVATGIYRMKIRVDGKTSEYDLLIGQ